MTQRDHTPGPWHWDAGDLGTEISQPASIPYCTVVSGHDENLVIAEVNDRFDLNQGRANARLIAAAPDLYEALKEWNEPGACGCDTAECRGTCLPAKTRAALAKTE